MPPEVVHAMTLVAGFVLLVIVDRHLWFFGDEWNFLADRGLHHSAQGLWQPHNEHWSTLPILLWRTLFSLFSLGSYWPYLIPLLLAHLLTAHLLWRAGRSDGAGLWSATVCAGVFVALGAGAENLTWAFQIGFVGSLLFGWGAVALVSRRPSRSNEALISVLLLASLACSSVGDAMWITAAVVLLCRRGWRAALRTVAVPTACYIVWYLIEGKRGAAADHIGMKTLAGLPRYVWDGLSGSLGNAVDLRPAGPILLIAFIAWVVVNFGALRRRSPCALGGAAGALAFFLLVGLGRYGKSGSPTASRYVYVCIALLLPAVMVAASQLLSGRHRRAQLVAMCTAAVILAVNVDLLVSFAGTRTSTVAANKRQLLTIATLLAGGSPSLSAQPVPLDPDLNTRTLVRFVAEGTLRAVVITPQERLDAEAGLDVGAFGAPPGFAAGRFELVGTTGPHAPITTGGCLLVEPSEIRQIALRPIGAMATVEMKSDPSLPFSVFLVSSAKEKATGNLLYTSAKGRTYVVDLVPDVMLIVSVPSKGGTTFCGLSGS